MSNTTQKMIFGSLAVGLHLIIVAYFMVFAGRVQGHKTTITGISIIMENSISDQPSPTLSPIVPVAQPAKIPEQKPLPVSHDLEVSKLRKASPKKIPSTTTQTSHNVQTSHASEPAASHSASSVPAPIAASSVTAPSASVAPASASDTSITGVRTLYRPDPLYPPLAKEQHQEGNVLLHIQVSDSGTPLAVTVKKTSGFDALDEAAAEAVRQWRFAPATKAGVPIATEVEIPILFHLE